MRIHVIDESTLAAMRSRPISDHHVAMAAGGGEPLRCCLRDADFGEPLLLTGYAPPMRPSPYRERGAVYLHAESRDCTQPPAGFPEMSLRRQQVARSYDSRDWILDSAVVGPGQIEKAVAELLEDPAAAYVDVRNPGPGCFMFRVDAGDVTAV